ncbi:hypothetical protein [Peterkaempfera griseoplana]|uniref:hypothetical protein n=1 Tax=Peterkaempfera griseoplana TaxID=66896 RepID=UPI0006E28C58|nr:hypothetical protein [Peterkaempfera griseoplana]
MAAALETWRRAGRLPYAPGAGLPGSRVLDSWHSVNGELVAFTLLAGEPRAQAGPFVSVRTAVTGDDLHGEVLNGLDEVIEDERDRLFELTGLDEGDGPRETCTSELTLLVDGVPVPARVRVEQPGADGEVELWAAQLTLRRSGRPMELTVTVRGLPVGEPPLVAADDLGPYLAGRERLLAETASGRSASAPAGEPVPSTAALGLSAHRQLALDGMERSRILAQQLSEGRTPRTPRRLRVREGGELWEEAVRQQMRLASEDRWEADESVTSMVNQLGWLAERADWAVGTEDGRQAVEETIRHTVFGSEVPSLRAQLAWRAVWSDPRHGREPGLAEWLAAWERWRRDRRRGARRDRGDITSQ